jgi:PKD repeat protein
MNRRPVRMLCRHLSRPALLICAITGLGALAGPAVATAAYTGHRLYAVSSNGQGGTLVPFDVSSDGQLHERSDQAVAVPGNTTGLLVDREARSVFVSSSDVQDPNNFRSRIPGVIEVFTIAADGALTLAQTVPSSSFAMTLAPDGSLFAQQMNGEIDSYPVVAGGTLGGRRTFYSFTQPATMFAVSPDGKTLYMDGQNALWFQWTIEADASLTSLAPGQWGPPGPWCYSPFIGLAVGSSNVDLQCSYGSGYTLTPAANGALTVSSGTFTGGGGRGNAEDAHGRAFYSSDSGFSIYQLQRQANGTLAPFAIPSVSSPNPINVLAADPGGTTLAAATSSHTFETYTIAADGSLSAGPAAIAPVTMSMPGFLAYSPQQAPVAALSSTQMASGSTTFDARSSRGLDGRTIARYDWSFGDGTTLADAGPMPSHTYPQTGDYSATVTVTDSAGCSVAGTFGGSIAICAGAPGAAASRAVHVAAAAPPAAVSPDSIEPQVTGTATAPAQTEAARPTAATAAPDTHGKKVLLTWGKPAGTPASSSTRYFLAWSTLHSAQGPGDPNMHHLRVVNKTHISMRTSPHTTLHVAVYAYGADGLFTRATKTTVRLP